MKQNPFRNPTQIESPHTDDDWLRLFNEENVQFTILDLHADAELVKAIRSQPEWTIDFEDDEAVIFARCARTGDGNGLL